jgi:hypothetical protein
VARTTVTRKKAYLGLCRRHRPDAAPSSSVTRPIYVCRGRSARASTPPRRAAPSRSR